jgi:hypothetical protein
MDPDWEAVELLVSRIRVPFPAAQKWYEPREPSVSLVAPDLQCVVQNRCYDQRHRWARTKDCVYDVIELQ